MAKIESGTTVVENIWLETAAECEHLVEDNLLRQISGRRRQLNDANIELETAAKGESSSEDGLKRHRAGDGCMR
jgi:hypothetical protein